MFADRMLMAGVVAVAGYARGNDRLMLSRNL